MGTKKGQSKYIETPEALLKLFEDYVKETKSNPFLVKDWVGKDGDQVYREKEKPITMEGFRVYAFKTEGCIKHYFDNTDNRYSNYSTICSHIREQIRAEQIAGGMAGIYNPSITQRLNSLVEKTDAVITTNTITLKLD